MILGKVPGSPIWAAVLLGAILVCVGIYYRGLAKQKPAWLFAAVIVGVGFSYSWGQSNWPDETVDDTQFLRRVNGEVPGSKLLAIDGAVGPLDFFRDQFYLRSSTLMLHNLSYLRSTEITGGDVYIVARMYDQAALQTLGAVQTIDQSEHSRRQKLPGQQLTLFHLFFKSDLQRFAPPKISVMQAMERESGPYCGPDIPEGGNPPE